MVVRARKPRVTKADIDRLADLVRALDLNIAAAETEPGKVRLITVAGRELTLPDDTASLDRELAGFRAAHGNG